MDGLFYTSKKTFRNLHQIDLEASLSLKDLQIKDLTRKEFLISLINDFKEILEQHEIKKLIEKIFALEGNLNRIKEDENGPSWIEDLSEFYKNLSPMLLRVVWESASFVNGSSEIVSKIVESLRVSLEEELFYWQEELKSIDK